MIEVVAVVLIPCFALSGFMFGSMTARGEIWPTRAFREEIRKLKNRHGVAEDRYDHLHRRYLAQGELLALYQKAYVYPLPPMECGTIIQEEPDVLLSS